MRMRELAGAGLQAGPLRKRGRSTCAIEEPRDVLRVAVLSRGIAEVSRCRPRLDMAGTLARCGVPRCDRTIVRMPALDTAVASDVANWVAAKQAVRVAQNLLEDDPSNRALQTRLLQATQTAEEAHLALKAALRTHNLTAAELQMYLRKQSGPAS
jgi:hypothetical protein